MALTARRLFYRGRSDQGRAVLLPFDCPAFEGNADPGITWICPKCERHLLVAVWERQFLDLFIRCPTCHTLAASPARSPGEPIPAASVKFPPGTYLLGSPCDTRGKPVLMAAESAFDAYVRETGANYSLTQASAPEAGRDLDAKRLLGLAKQARRLLGPHSQDLANADRKGLTSPTPPRRRHRLLELIEYAEQAATQLAHRTSNEVVVLNGDALSELLATVALFERWRHHPRWRKLRDSLIDPLEVQHSVMTLGVASFLVDAGNGVGLVDHVGAQHRVPDLWLVPRIVERLEVEVKTPLVLRAPGPRGLPADAIRLVTGLIDQAASSKRGQLSPQHSGIVAIGCFHLGERGLNQLESAVSQVLEQQAHAKRKPHLIAVVVFDVSYQLTAARDGSGMLASTNVSPAISHRLVAHPGYAGTLSITHQTAWQTWGGTPSQKT